MVSLLFISASFTIAQNIPVIPFGFPQNHAGHSERVPTMGGIYFFFAKSPASTMINFFGDK